MSSVTPDIQKSSPDGTNEGHAHKSANRLNTTGKWWTFSTGCFFVIWFGLLAAGQSRMLRDPGTLWHTVVGEHILESGELVHHDPFAFTEGGRPWIAQQWLGECAMALLHRAAGLDGIVLAAVTLLAAVFAGIAGRLQRTGLQWPACGCIVMLVIGASSYHFIPRPHLATIAFLACTFGLLTDVESRRAPLWRLLLLPPILVVWTNTHGGALGGIATIFLAVMGWFLRPRWVPRVNGDPVRPIKPLLTIAVLGLSFAAVLANPYGTALPRVWISLMGSDLLPFLIQEHAPLELLSSEGLMISLLGTVYLGLLYSVRANGYRVTWLVPMAWLVLAYTRVRHGPLFAVTAAIAIADMLPHSSLPRWFIERGSRLFTAPRSSGGRLRQSLIPACLVIMAFGLQVSQVRIPIVGAGWCKLNPAYWPIDATEALRDHVESHPDDMRVFNDMRFGGYLIYHLPEVRVFIDDRCELYREHGLRRYVELRRNPELLEPLARSDGIRLALVQTRSPIASFLSKQPGWTRLHEDPTASLFHRTD